MKTLRVCLYKDLPTSDERDTNYIYFAYNVLKIYFGETLYDNSFVIAEKIPAEPVSNILYILFDGTVNIYLDYSIKQIATIEDEEQIELLKKVGSMMYSNNHGNYQNLTTRSMVTPFDDGIYQIVVSLQKGTIIDKHTLIAYNEETGMFEVIGKKDPSINFNNEVYGVETNTISTIVSDMRINAHVKISQAYENIIRVLSDGIYASVSDRVTKEKFNEFNDEFEDYKNDMTDKLDNLDKEISSFTGDIDMEKINEQIKLALEEVYPEIDEALNLIDNSLEKISEVETNVKAYADTKYQEAYSDLYDTVKESIEHPWENIDPATEE